MEAGDGGAVVRAQSGDGDAFRSLVERHSRSVFRLAYRMTGNEQDAEDVVQETFLRAFRQIRTYDGRSAFSTWIYRIAANYSLDLIRVRKHENKATTADEECDLLDSAPGHDPGPDRLAFSGEVGRLLASALDSLSAQERTSFVLRHYEGLSIEEISSALGASANATKHSIFRAVQKIRRRLAPAMSSAHE